MHYPFSLVRQLSRAGTLPVSDLKCLYPQRVWQGRTRKNFASFSLEALLDLQ